MMLGTRTKQVFSYGKRHQRIVNVSDNRETTDPFSSIQNTTAVLRAPIASRVKGRENFTNSPSLSPRTVKIHRKKRPSPVFSPPSGSLAKAKQRMRVQVIIDSKKVMTTAPRSPIPPPQSKPDIIRYLDFSSPVQRPRQLTPIRGVAGSHFRRPFEPPSPPSPTTPTDFGLSFELSHIDLNLTSSDPILKSASRGLHIEAPPEYLLPLLEECAQETCGPHEFSAFIDMFPLDPIVRDAESNDRGEGMTFRKIGEASYSEVFGIGDVVLKIIPLRDESPKDRPAKGPTPQASNKNRFEAVKYGDVTREAHKEEEEEGPPPSDTKDVLKEVIVTRAMGEMCEGFVKLLRTYVVRGRYPEVLLKLWDEYYERKGSENVRPDTFSVSQVYTIIVLPNGGPDLEAYSFTSASKYGWRQACSLFWQVTRAIAQAEQLVSFEHRDLHWGQILVKNVPSTHLMPLKPKIPLQTVAIDQPLYGVKATVIDLGLSRMDAGDGAGGEKVHWTPFSEEIFMGEGDYQYDVYRIMRIHTQDAWEEFKPLTNVMWLHYLTLKLLHSKRLKPPSSSRRIAASSSPPAIFTEKYSYECLVEVEKVLSRCVAEVAKPKASLKRKGRRKIQAPANENVQATMMGPQSASEVIGYALKRGWLL